MKFSEYLDSHEYPPILFKYPHLVRVIQRINMLLTLRNWYVRRSLRKILGETSENFSMLDAGCGLGDFALRAALDYPHSSVVGVDFSAANVRLARNLSAKMKLGNITFLEKNLFEYRSTHQFDVILCNAVLQSIQNDDGVLLNLVNGLKKEGCLLLYLPVHYKRYLPFFGSLEDKYLDQSFYRYDGSFSHHRYSPQDVMTKCKASGLRIIRQEFSYGAAGAVSFELYSLLLVVLKKVPSLFLLFLVPLYASLIFPLQLILMIIDFLTKRNDGNGMLIVARRS
ncbi:MAG: class I SAM-dependent methyltransferase [Ignavibacteriales bacterium]|nr:class I SAM-dependent methyltransferase [Ignavibacteriales bacterium]